MKTETILLKFSSKNKSYIEANNILTLTPKSKIMKSNTLKQISKEPHLKLVKNSIGDKQQLKTKVKRIYINTLVPGFNYINQVGKLITPHKCILL